MLCRDVEIPTRAPAEGSDTVNASHPAAAISRPMELQMIRCFIIRWQHTAYLWYALYVFVCVCVCVCTRRQFVVELSFSTLDRPSFFSVAHVFSRVTRR